MYDVVAIGELLVDFIQEDPTDTGKRLYSANPGGAPCNLLAMMRRLGKEAAFIGKVGNDALGYMRKIMVRGSVLIQISGNCSGIRKPYCGNR